MLMATMEFDNYDAGTAEFFLKPPMLNDGIMGYLGIHHTHIGPGTLTAELTVRPDCLNPFGSLHGGVISALCDHVLGSVCYPVIPRGAWAATAEFKINLLAPVKEGTLSARAQIVSLTKKTAVVRIDVTNGQRLAAVAQGTVLIQPPKPKA